MLRNKLNFSTDTTAFLLPLSFTPHPPIPPPSIHHTLFPFRIFYLRIFCTISFDLFKLIKSKKKTFKFSVEFQKTIILQDKIIFSAKKKM